MTSWRSLCHRPDIWSGKITTTDMEDRSWTVANWVGEGGVRTGISAGTA
jgi:hypothetical protein